MRFAFALAAASFTLFSAAGSVLAQDYPSHPLRLIVPYAAGGPTDVRGRVVAAKLKETLGESVVVENRPGAGTIIGTRAVLSAPADGYTLLMQSSSMAIATLTYKTPGYRMEDFKLVAPLGSAPFVLGANKDLPVKNVQELVAYAKANPGKLNNASLGAGGLSQLLVERFKAAAGLNIVDIPYGGSAPALSALEAGSVQLFMDSLSTSVPAARSGAIKVLGVTTDKRLTKTPDIPTFREQGYPTVVGGTWMAYFVSAKTPDPIVQKLRQATTRAVQSPDVKDKIGVLGFEVWSESPQEFEIFVTRDFQLWEADIKRLNLPLLD
jgi:tripartite-type tricarboxylate transporter receptor subunit TctC